MIQQFTLPSNNNPILICIHDILDTCTSDWSKEIAKNLSDYMINRFLKYGFDVCIGTDENELLKTYAGKYTHAVIIAAGTSTRLSDRLIFALKDKCSEDFYIAGHVLNRDENYYELHHQFYIVNLKTHTELGFPELGEPSTVSHTKLEPVSNTNDGYIAQELSLGTVERQYTGLMHGWNLLTVALANNKRVIDLGNTIRDNKKYFYYEYDHVFLKESTSLFYNKFFFNNIVVPFNSDGLAKEIKFDGPVDQYITLGTGLNWVENLHKLGFTENTEIIFTDYNPLVLQFMQAMTRDWDGKNYMEFYKSMNFIIPNNIPYDYEGFLQQSSNQWEQFVSQTDNWEEKWNNVKKLKFKFIAIDYMSEYNFDWIESGKRTIFNASDMFDHVPVIFYQSMKYRIAAENRFINRLKEKDPNIFLIWTGRSAQSFLLDKYHPKFQPISEVELIDIDKINRPYWHKDDWNVLRPLV